MEWFNLELTRDDLVYLVWFFSVVGGYCFGRAHAQWILIRNFIKAHKNV